MKRKLSVFLLAVVMLLSVCPIASVSAEAPAAWLENVRIEGNFVEGQTLVAEYDIPEECSTIDAAKTAASVVWYREDYAGGAGTRDKIMTTGRSENSETNRSELVITNSNATSGTGYFVTTTGAQMCDIFFKVTPKDADGNAFKDANGNDIVISSPIGTHAVASDATLPELITPYNTTILPLAQPGSMNVGDTVVANYSYRGPIGKAPTSTKYEWYLVDIDTTEGGSAWTDIETTLASATPTFTSTTSNEYDIQAADAGKWICVKITPYIDATAQTPAWAMNHVGNVTIAVPAANVTRTGFSAVNPGTVNVLGDYLRSWASAYTAGNVGSHSSTTYHELNAVFDAGEVVPFDSVLITKGLCQNKTVKTTVVSYSLDNETWYNAKAINEIASGDHVYELDEVKYARYFKIALHSDGTTKMVRYTNIADFIPFVRSNAKQVAVATAEAANYEVAPHKIIVKKTNKTLANVRAAIEAKDYSDNALTVSFVSGTVDTADAAAATAVNGYDLSGNIVEGAAIEDETTPVDANLTGAYLKAVDSKGVPTYYAIAYEPEFELSWVVVDSKIATPGENVTGDKVLTVNAWGTPSDALLNAITVTGGTKSFVDGEGNPKAAFVVNEDLTDTYLLAQVGSASAKFEVKYAGHLYSYDGNTYYAKNNNNSTVYKNSVLVTADANADMNEYCQVRIPDLDGKYLMKAKISVSNNASETGGMGFTAIFGTYSTTNGYYDQWMDTILKFMKSNDNQVSVDNALAGTYNTGYRFTNGTHGSSATYVWQDVEILWDFSTTKAYGDTGLSQTQVSAWVNGAQVLDKVWMQHNANITEADPYFAPCFEKGATVLASGSAANRNRFGYVTFRKVYDADTHVTTSNPYNFTLGGVASGSTVAAGTAVTLASTATSAGLDFYYGETDGYTNFLVEYTTDANGKTVVEQVKSAVGAWPTITPTAAGNTIKAFSFDTDYLVPNVNVGEWTVVAAQ